MKHTNTILNQLLKFLPRQHFQTTVDRHKGDYRTRSLRCWDQLVVMLFSQLSGRHSLRDLVDTFNSKQSHYFKIRNWVFTQPRHLEDILEIIKFTV